MMEIPHILLTSLQNLTNFVYVFGFQNVHFVFTIIGKRPNEFVCGVSFTVFKVNVVLDQRGFLKNTIILEFHIQGFMVYTTGIK